MDIIRESRMEISKIAHHVLSRIDEVRARMPACGVLSLYTVAETKERHQALLASLDLTTDKRKHFLSYKGVELPGVVWIPLRFPFGTQRRGIRGHTALLTLIDSTLELGMEDDAEVAEALESLGRASISVGRSLTIRPRDLIGTLRVLSTVQADPPRLAVAKVPAFDAPYKMETFVRDMEDLGLDKEDAETVLRRLMLGMELKIGMAAGSEIRYGRVVATALDKRGTVADASSGPASLCDFVVTIDGVAQDNLVAMEFSPIDARSNELAYCTARFIPFDMPKWNIPPASS
jgi:hypothetical protein